MKTLALILSLVLSSLFTPNNGNTAFAKQDTEIKGNKAFAKFLSHFEKSDSPLSMDQSDLKKLLGYSHAASTKNLIGNEVSNEDLQEFLPFAKRSKFSRMGPPIVRPLNRFYPDESIIAVTYTMKSSMFISGSTVMMSLFDLRGNMIEQPARDKFAYQAVLLAQESPENMVVCSGRAPNEIYRTTFKNIWKKDYYQFGMEGNSIVKYEKQKMEVLKIEPDGKVKIQENLYAHVDLEK